MRWAYIRAGIKMKKRKTADITVQDRESENKMYIYLKNKIKMYIYVYMFPVNRRRIALVPKKCSKTLPRTQNGRYLILLCLDAKRC